MGLFGGRGCGSGNGVGLWGRVWVGMQLGIRTKFIGILLVAAVIPLCIGILGMAVLGSRYYRREKGILFESLAIRYAREKGVPFLGLCLGMQCAVIEFARNVCGLTEANSTEFKPKVKQAVISMLAEQHKIKDMGGTMRLGAYPCKIKRGTLAERVYKASTISERHRHRYEFNNKYRSLLEKNGMVFSGIYPAKNLVEIIELPKAAGKAHPYFIAVQYHPEFKSKPDRPHPLFRDFIKAALKAPNS